MASGGYGNIPPVSETPATTPSQSRVAIRASERALERLIGRDPDVQSVSIVLLFGLGILVAGLSAVSGSNDWGFSWDGAVNGVLSQIGVTGPAAVLMAIACCVNVLAGAMLLRILGTAAFGSLTELILAGAAAAVLLDAALLFLLGSFGLFGWPELVAVHAAIAAIWAAGNRWPLLARRATLHARRPAAWWLLVVAVWSYPVIVQLASPAAPFMDVLPNHVAPVEHVRTFGSFETLTTSPSPIYGPSRLMLGYVALMSNLTVITNLQAILAVAAFALPLTVLTAISIRYLAGQLFGGGAAFWILLMFPLTFTFMRLPDTRGTVAAFPFAAYALGRIAGELRARWHHPPQASQAALAPQPDLPLAAALGASILLHPIIGLVAAAASVGLLILDPRRLGPILTPALLTAGILALPQAITMGAISAPSWTGVGFMAAAIMMSYFLAWLFAPGRVALPFSIPREVQAVLIAWAIVLALFVAFETIASPVSPEDPATVMVVNFPHMLTLTVLGLVLWMVLRTVELTRGWLVLGAGIAAGAGAWAASGLVGNADLTQQAIHYEVPKTIEYWLPVMLALGAAAAIAAIMRYRDLGFVRYVLLAGIVFLTLYPFPEPLTSNDQIGEHRGAEAVGLALREAQTGYWAFYPDSRRIVDASEQEVIDQLMSEVAAGRLGPTSRVLHIASSFQQWVSVPIGVFTGIDETSVSSHPELSIHTEGGRLLGLSSLGSELASGYDYVVLEPSPTLPSDLDSQITTAGYHKVWSNSMATIYARN